MGSEQVWLLALVLSFCYERPLAELSPYDRINPRLFDLVFLVGLALLLFSRHRAPLRLSKPLRVWAALVLWFCICAVIYTIFLLPIEQGMFSLFFAGRYVQGLVVLYLALIDIYRKEFGSVSIWWTNHGPAG
jgi:hypothetical protein